MNLISHPNYFNMLINTYTLKKINHSNATEEHILGF